MELKREEVLHIAKLARISLSQDDVEMYRRQLSQILEHFTILQEVDTAGVPLTSNPLSLSNVMKEDKVKPSLSTNDVLANAPQQEDQFFKTKAVLE
ncbi:MAG: Asp-tRNA(Asn)/Glu-tRNA(Gln) amidotransferase subunit GatC [Chloroflexi bacterium]|nr:Asp-tRNA(Asn)/Glu-tRNA(Gln) amidotransferase subunit GatC [Chloroflexota bacterium]